MARHTVAPPAVISLAMEDLKPDWAELLRIWHKLPNDRARHELLRIAQFLLNELRGRYLDS